MGVAGPNIQITNLTKLPLLLEEQKGRVFLLFLDFPPRRFRGGWRCYRLIKRTGSCSALVGSRQVTISGQGGLTVVHRRVELVGWGLTVCKPHDFLASAAIRAPLIGESILFFDGLSPCSSCIRCIMPWDTGLGGTLVCCYLRDTHRWSAAVAGCCVRAVLPWCCAHHPLVVGA